MSDISGPPQTRDSSNSVRAPEKSKAVSKDPDGAKTTSQQHGNQQPQSQSKEAYGGRDPAVSIAASTALLKEGQQISGSITKLDAEGRPILETNTATVALRPDAGLKSNDIITLKITDTAKELAADLMKRNGIAETSPQRVSITIISIKGTAPADGAPSGSGGEKGQAYAPAHPKTTGVPQDDDARLALLLKASNAPAENSETQKPNTTVNEQTPLSKTATVGASASTASTSVLAQTPAEQNANLLSAQHSATAISTAPNRAGTNLTGLGAPILAATPEGKTITLQPLDLAVSNVPPREIAIIERITPLAATEAKALSIPAKLLSGVPTSLSTTGQNADLSLVKLETSRGTFIAPSQVAANLSGESVRVTEGSASPSGQAKHSSPSTSQFRALWVEDRSGALPKKISVEFTTQALNSAPPGRAIANATITSVQTISAFMGAGGASADLRLQTTQGDISLTLPSSARPSVGDTVHMFADSNRSDILPLPQSTAVAASISAAGAETLQVAAGAASQVSAAAAMLSNWPVFEEAVAALAAANPEAAANLSEKSAQGGGKLTNSLLFFLKAAGRATTSEAWIGDKTTAALELTSKNLLDQLRNDVRQMARMASEPVGEWRPIIVPFEARLGDFPLVAFLIQNQSHRDSDEQSSSPDDEKETDEQRFIVQVAFSVLGDIQLDGRIKHHQFDLTVRSKQAFSAELTSDTKLLFDQALAANGFNGGLQFEETDTFPVDAATVTNEQMMATAEPVI